MESCECHKAGKDSVYRFFLFLIQMEKPSTEDWFLLPEVKRVLQ